MLHDAVRRQARLRPDAVAVVAPERTMDYRQLDCLSDVLSVRLWERGVRKGDRVVIWLDKTARTVAFMQATLRLGAVYVLVDGANPASRTLTIIRDCDPAAIVTTADRSRTLSDLEAALAPLLLDSETRLPADGASAGSVTTVDAGHDTDDNAPAYILYTSGSTGTPKGVCVSHRNASAFVEWAVAELRATSEDRFANHAPFTFDLSVLDLYGAFFSGGSVHLIPAEMSYAPSLLVDFLTRYGITIWYSVPSVLILMMREGGLLDSPAPAGLRALVFAGEPFAMEHLARLHAWAAERRLLNFYGPTETNVCTFHEVTGEDLARCRTLPIGRACCGVQVWAETPGGGRARVGEEGELVVCGPTVMLGYWGRDPQGEVYRTGDLVRPLPDGAFAYVGRLDQMLKVRGHRVEPGEIEAALLKHPAVADAAVVVSGSGMDARLVAFIVPVDGLRPSLLSLKRWCAEHLPHYMNIDTARTLDALPRTANGKTNRRLLAEAASSASDALAPPCRSPRSALGTTTGGQG